MVVHLTVVMLALGLVLFERDMTVVAVKEPNLHSERVNKWLAQHRMYALSRWVHSALGVLVLDTRSRYGAKPAWMAAPQGGYAVEQG